MRKIDINKKDLEVFFSFSEKNKLKFKKCVRFVYCNSIYFGETSQTLISWNVNEKDEILKFTVALINQLLKDCKLIFKEEE